MLRFTSSLALDGALLRVDLLGSLAHARMLAAVGLMPAAEAEVVQQALRDLLRGAEDGSLQLPDEEDVHMAVEVRLTERLGKSAGRLHTARSRNDQVSLDLRLFVREQLRLALASLAALMEQLLARARLEDSVLLPSYTHRQQAQAISASYFWAGYLEMLARDGQALGFALEQANVLPLGVGAIAGTAYRSTAV